MSRRLAADVRGWAAFLAIFSCAMDVFPQRVVSLAPGLTEIVFALDRGGSLVGVTKFCDFPPQAGKIAKVGGFLDVNLEALLALAPDVVLAYPEHAPRLRALPEYMRVVTVRHGSLSDLLASMSEIGRVLGRERTARLMINSIQERLERLAAKAVGRKRARVLFVAGRSAGELRNMFIVGRRDFLNDLLEVAGGVNAYQGSIAYPGISLETVIALAPEFILEISSHFEGIDDEEIHSLWRPLSMVPAVANRRVQVIRDPAWLRPGPRVAEVAEDLARLLQPAPRIPREGTGRKP